MGIYNKLTKNFIGTLSSTLLLSIFNFIFFTGMSLVLNSNSFGMFSFYYSLILFLAPFLELGMSTLLMSSDDKQTIANLNSCLSFLIILIVIIGFILIPFNIFYSLIVFNISSLILFQFIQSLFIKNKSNLDQNIFVIMNGIIKVITIVVVIVLNKYDIKVLPFIFLLLIVSNVIPLIIMYKKINFRINYSFDFVNLNYWNSIKWIAASSIIVTLIMRFDQMLIGVFVDKTLLGFYMIAIQWLSIISILGNSLLKFSFAESNNISTEHYYSVLERYTFRINFILIFLFFIILISTILTAVVIYDNNYYIIQSLLILSVGFFFSIKYNLFSVMMYKLNLTNQLFYIQIKQFIIQLIMVLLFFNSLGFYIFPLSFSVIRIYSYFYIKSKIPLYLSKNIHRID